MSRTRLFALAVTVALHLFVLWSMLQGTRAGTRSPEAASAPRRSEPTTPAEAADPQLPRGTDASMRARHVQAHQQRSSPPDQTTRAARDQAWRRAYELGRAFEPVRKEWLRRTFRKEFGDDIAALLDLPFTEAWQQLETLTIEGDKQAARALNELTGFCRQPNAAVDPTMLDMLTRNTEAVDAAFIQGAYEAEMETQRTWAQCGTDLGLPRLRALVERKLGAAASEALRAKGPQDWAVAWQAYHSAYDIEGPPETTDPMEQLARRLSAPDGSESQADVDALLAAIDKDPRALNQLAFCFINGCNGIDAMPPDERLSWSLRAARTGFYPAVRDVVEQTRRSDPVAAYQWAAFERALWLEGCGELINAGMLSMLMQWQHEIASAMTPAERALGERRAQELLARYRDGAMLVQGCAPEH